MGFIGQRQTEEAAERDGAGCAALYISVSLFFAPRFLKSCCPERSEEHRPSYVRTAVSLRREGNLIQVEDADNTLGHMRIGPH